jgi:peroxiredoxin family protein
MQVMLDILPFEAAVHVWDLYISEGRKVIFSTTLAIFKLHENVLKKYEFDEMIRYLNRLEFTDCDVEELMKITTKQKIKHKKIHGFETLYEKEQKSKAQRKN